MCLFDRNFSLLYFTRSKKKTVHSDAVGIRVTQRGELNRNRTKKKFSLFLRRNISRIAIKLCGSNKLAAKYFPLHSRNKQSKFLSVCFFYSPICYSPQRNNCFGFARALLYTAQQTCYNMAKCFLTDMLIIRTYTTTNKDTFCIYVRSSLFF